VVDDRVHQSRELAGIAEGSLADCAEDALEHGVEVEVLVVVGVAEVFDVFAEVAEEEDVFFADFSGDLGMFVSCQLQRGLCDFACLDVGAIARSDDQATVQDELHVAITALANPS
jgi:hypothetical protein